MQWKRARFGFTLTHSSWLRIRASGIVFVALKRVSSVSTTSVRVLIVDDFEPFRCLLRSMLQDHSEFQVVCEVSDGLQAIEQAQTLQPDLILLDITLPELSGIEAARRILKLSPKSKIVFVSQHSSADVMRTALATGAIGYVVKADAGRELLPALNAAHRGETFISERLAIRGSRLH